MSLAWLESRPAPTGPVSTTAIGAVFVLALWALAGLGFRSGPGRALPLLTVGLGPLIPTFGMVHIRLVPGAAHWVVQVAHLLLGIAGMILAARLERGVKLAAGGSQQPTQAYSPRARQAA